MPALAVNPRPCDSCPYRRDTPPGLWHPSEYRKLPGYDEGASPPTVGVFLCHQTGASGQTACRGWLTVAVDSIAVRLAILRGQVTPARRDAAVDVPLYASGTEACAAGLAGVRRPNAAARRTIAKLMKRKDRNAVRERNDRQR